MPEPVIRTYVLPDTPEAAGIARAYVADLVAAHGLPHLADEATLLTSELVTNALCHGAGKPELALELRGFVLRIEVFDTGPGVPSPGTPDPDSTSGRGLCLVQLLATRWGFTRSPDGKSTWCELAARSVEGRGHEAAGRVR